MGDYVYVNRAYWDERVAAHAASPDYGVARFSDDPSYLSDVVRFDLPRLGDIHGLDVVHLQCHIGTDTVSLARLGARVTGIDMSAPALLEARALAQAADVDATFVQAELYAAPTVLGSDRFDLVYTGMGALNWLPDIQRWGEVVAALLRPSGRLHIREVHPVLWSLDPAHPEGLLLVDFPYFETSEPIIYDDGQEFGDTYVHTDQVFTTKITHEWNHGIGEIVTALLDAGMQLTLLQEHDSIPSKTLTNMVDVGDDEWQIADRPQRLPHTYTLQARRADSPIR